MNNENIIVFANKKGPFADIICKFFGHDTKIEMFDLHSRDSFLMEKTEVKYCKRCHIYEIRVVEKYRPMWY